MLGPTLNGDTSLRWRRAPWAALGTDDPPLALLVPAHGPAASILAPNWQGGAASGALLLQEPGWSVLRMLDLDVELLWGSRGAPIMATEAC